MVVIFIIPLQTWPWQQYVPVPQNTMGHRTGNVCYVVVISAQVLSYPYRRQINIQQTCIQQYDFTFTIMFHVVIFTGNIHTTNDKHVHCVPQCRSLTGLPKYTQKITWVTRNINNIISRNKLNSSDKKTGI